MSAGKNTSVLAGTISTSTANIRLNKNLGIIPKITLCIICGAPILDLPLGVGIRMGGSAVGELWLVATRESLF